MSAYRFGWWFAFALLLGGCLPAARDSSLALRDSLRLYASHIRWGRFEEAARWHTPATAPAAREQAARYQTTVRVLSADLEAVHLLVPDAEAEAQLKISYHLDNSSQVRQTLHTQRWVYEPESGVWRLDGPMPKFP